MKGRDNILTLALGQSYSRVVYVDLEDDFVAIRKLRSLHQGASPSDFGDSQMSLLTRFLYELARSDRI